MPALSTCFRFETLMMNLTLSLINILCILKPKIKVTKKLTFSSRRALTFMWSCPELKVFQQKLWIKKGFLKKMSDIFPIQNFVQHNSNLRLKRGSSCYKSKLFVNQNSMWCKTLKLHAQMPRCESKVAIWGVKHSILKSSVTR